MIDPPCGSSRTQNNERKFAHAATVQCSVPVEERFALQDLLTDYCTAIDARSDMEGLLACFTDDAVWDGSALDLPRLDGHAAIRGFFAHVSYRLDAVRSADGWKFTAFVATPLMPPPATVVGIHGR